MHDIVDLESRGVASVFLASSEFIEAAESQARALGAEPDAVYVPHPIQDRTDEEMRALADSSFEEIVSKIVAAL